MLFIDFFHKIVPRAWIKKDGSLRQRILLIFLSLSLLPLILLGVVSLFFVITYQNQQTNSFQKEISKRVIREIGGLPLHIETKLLDIAAAVQLLSLNEQEIYDFMAYSRACNHQGFGDHIEEIALLDQSGQEFKKISRRRVIGPQDLADRSKTEIFNEIKEGKHLTIGPISFDHSSFEPYISFGVPITDIQTGEMKGALTALVRVQITFDEAFHKEGGDPGAIFMTDDQGLVLAHPNPSVVYRGTRYSDVGKTGFRIGTSGQFVKSFSTRFNLGKRQFWLISEIAFPEAIELAQKMVISSLCLLVFLLIGCFYLLGKAINHTVLPIERLALTAELIGQGNWQEQVEEKGIKEINMLAKSFNAMTAILTNKIKEEGLANKRLQGQIDTVALMQDEKEKLRVKMITQGKLASLGEIATGIAHEINQPLSYIKIMFEAILHDYRGNRRLDIEELVEDSQESLKQVHRITVIIDHLRTFARTDGTQYEEADIPTIIDNTLILTRERLRINNIQLALNIAEELPKLKASVVKIEQVLINLFQNSIDALVETAGGEIKILVYSVDEFIKIEFTDSGHGIAEEIRENIFEPFFTTKEVGKGTGLGLSIVYGIVTEHNGEIEYVPRERGATFVITLPAIKDN